MVVSSCAQPEGEPVELTTDGLMEAAAAIDPCAWDGQRSYCYADMGFVFSGGHCVAVCIGPQRNAQRTVFAERDECVLACSCKREKFSAPFSLGDRCDAAWAELVPGAPAPWDGCPQGAARCALGVTGPLDSHGLASLCAASAFPQVARVVCEDSSPR